jgi:hypothetical protein
LSRLPDLYARILSLRYSRFSFSPMIFNPRRSSGTRSVGGRLRDVRSFVDEPWLEGGLAYWNLHRNPCRSTTD